MATRRAETIEDVKQEYGERLYEALSQRDEYKRQRDELIANVRRLEQVALRSGLHDLSSPEMALFEYMDNELITSYYVYDSDLNPAFNPSLYEPYAPEAGPCNHCKHETGEES